MKASESPGMPHIESTFVVFDAKGTAAPVGVTETFWEDLKNRFGDFSGNLLASSFRFDQDWDNWEIHPYGDEVVCHLSGDFDLVLEENGGYRTVRLNREGLFVIVPRGTWHTATVRSPSSALFLTPGRGTMTKPKDPGADQADNRGTVKESPAISPETAAPNPGTPASSLVLNQLNLVAKDFDRTVAFYRKLGFEIVEAPPSPEGIRHAKAKLPDGFLLEFDNETLARFYNAAWRDEQKREGVVIGFRLTTREEVDRRYDELLSSGYTGLQAPYDAFWGARYAIIADPDGHAIGLMSPLEEACRTWPPAFSPSL